VDEIPAEYAADYRSESALIGDADVDERRDDQRDESAIEPDDASLMEQKRRPRRRRRRRGGREDRSSEKESAENRTGRSRFTPADRDVEERTEDLAADEDDFISSTPSDEDLVEGVTDANGESTESVARGRSALQRSIPSWDEAIGYIVELNMQSRSQRRPTSHSGSRPHAPRNRTRGRHKKHDNG
jgi:hypothetical protein